MAVPDRGTEGEATTGSSTYGGGAARAGAGKARRARVLGRGTWQCGFPRRFDVRARIGRPVALGGAASGSAACLGARAGSTTRRGRARRSGRRDAAFRQKLIPTATV
jgi:hypothetical protein